MTKSRDAWQEKATRRATEAREQRRQLLKERERRKNAEKKLKELQKQPASPPF